MKPQPVIVLLAADGLLPQAAVEAQRAHRSGAPAWQRTLEHAMRTGWRVVVVTAPAAVPLLTPWVATRDLVVLSTADQRRGAGFALAAGVGATADAAGWLLLPGPMPPVGSATLAAVGAVLAEHPAAYAQQRGRRCPPLGFAGELYSDLVKLEGADAAWRLLDRYPALGVEVDDPALGAEDTVRVADVG